MRDAQLAKANPDAAKTVAVATVAGRIPSVDAATAGDRGAGSGTTVTSLF
jgi:hypothetical protein